MRPEHARQGAAAPGPSLPVALLAPDGTLLDVDDALCRLTGHGRDQLVGTTLQSLALTAADAAVVERALATVHEGATHGDLDQEWYPPPGADRPLHVRVAWSVTGWDDGRPATLTAFVIDQSRDVQAAQRWRALLRHAADITWTATGEGVVTAVTPGVEHQLGWPADSVVGRSVLDLPHPEDVPAVRDAWEQVVSGRTRQQVLECRLPHADGRWLWVRQTLTDLRDDPHVQAVVGNAVDVTERRVAQAAANLHEARFRGRFEQSAVPQTFCDLDGLLTEVNDAFCRLVDRPVEEVLGRTLRELLHRTDPDPDDDELAALLRGESTTRQYEHVLARPDGRPVPVLVDASLLHDDRGRPTGAAAFLSDLTTLRGVERKRLQQHEFFLALARRASDLALVTDAGGRLVYASPALTSMLGYGIEDVIAQPGTDFVHEDDVEATMETFLRVVAEGGAETLTLRVRDAAGAWHWMEQTATNLLDTAVGGVVCNLRDITDRVAAEAALRASESRYRAIADNADEGLWVMAPDGRTLYVNARLVEILGLPESDILGREFLDVLDDKQPLTVRTPPATPGLRGPERYEISYRHPDGRVRILAVSRAPLDDAGGALGGSLAMVSDITESHELLEQLERAALHDELTGLPNRALLFDRLERALELETRGTAVLFVDLDRFKFVNDARGHATGDELLKGVAERLRQATRPVDTVARLGGDEFLVVCEDVDERAARSIAHHVLTSLQQPFSVHGGEAVLTASVGVALSPAPSAQALLRHADTAMYAAKLAGRGRVRLFDAALEAHAEERFELGIDLRRALVADDLELHYQPIIGLSSGRVLAVEALARWDRPGHGPVPPGRFVPVAEDVGLAGQLDRWALARAVREAAELRRAGALPPDAYVAVNVSARTLSDPELEEWIGRHVDAAGLTPRDVLIEVTESAIMADTTTAVGLLTRLRSRGYGIAVDDFGTGHSALAYLRRLPLSVLKIDRSFVAELTSDTSAMAIAASIIDLARAVGVRVVAEGVETPAVAELLRGLGCDAAQGWLWSAAVPPAEARATGALQRRYDVGG